jgi:hypothetical protein
MHDVAKAALFGGLVYAAAAALKHGFGVLYTHVHYVLVYCFSGYFPEQAAKVGLVQINQFRKAFHRELVRVTPGDKARYFIYTVVYRGIADPVYENFAKTVQNQHKQGPCPD